MFITSLHLIATEKIHLGYHIDISTNGSRIWSRRPELFPSHFSCIRAWKVTQTLISWHCTTTYIFNCHIYLSRVAAPISLIFMQFPAQILPNNRLVHHDSCSLLEILDPPLMCILPLLILWCKLS